MSAAWKRLITIVTALVFIFAMSVQAVPSAEALGLMAMDQAAGMDEHCPRMAVEHPERGVPEPKPCKGIMHDCVMQMGCIGSPSLSFRTAETQPAVSDAAVTYWSPSEERSGLSRKPDLFPPIAG